MPFSWRLGGTYFETCNCTAVSPRRRLNGRPESRPTHGVCQFLLTWRIDWGFADRLDLAGHTVAMAGSYDDDEPGSPWSVVLYLDRKANENERRALTSIFLGTSGGDLFFADNIARVLAIRPAEIDVDHTPGREQVSIRGFASATVTGAADYDGVVTSGIPGHQHAGREEVAAASVQDGVFAWAYERRSAFASEFAYASDWADPR
jgi:hypothetical protein